MFSPSGLPGARQLSAPVERVARVLLIKMNVSIDRRVVKRQVEAAGDVQRHRHRRNVAALQSSDWPPKKVSPTTLSSGQRLIYINVDYCGGLPGVSGL